MSQYGSIKGKREVVKYMSKNIYSHCERSEAIPESLRLLRFARNDVNRTVLGGKHQASGVSAALGDLQKINYPYSVVRSRSVSVGAASRREGQTSCTMNEHQRARRSHYKSPEGQRA
ncbi:hypothetical protein NIES2100_28820 [Calothrix sp. NIES-2100]|nr:hypothetical protein NIES2100_28820 [Calothrix sp. NIES-2100]